MEQYLVKWESGKWQILTPAELRKDLDDYDTAPPRLYVLRELDPVRRWLVRIDKGSWLVSDMYRNMSEI